jgi:hypothetical protein
MTLPPTHRNYSSNYNQKYKIVLVKCEICHKQVDNILIHFNLCYKKKIDNILKIIDDEIEKCKFLFLREDSFVNLSDLSSDQEIFFYTKN